MADGERAKPLIGELLPPFPRVMVQANPFTPATAREYCGAGTTIAEMVAGAGIPVEYAECVQVFLGDEEVNCALWGRVKPKPGAEVFIRVSLRGGDGGGKDVLRVVAMIAVMVVAMVVAPYLTNFMLNGMAATLPAASFIVADAVIGAALMTAGTMLVNALIPPPTPKSQWGFDQDMGSPYGQITGLRNQAAPYGPIPRVFGRRRVFPMLAGRPYTETVGNDQYLIMLLLNGFGPLKISEVKLGETPIENTPGIQMEIREGWPADAPVTLYRKAIREDGYSVILESLGDETIKTTKLDTVEISVELSFPSGVNRVKDGELRYTECEFSVQYRAAGSGGAWIDANWIDKNTAYGTQNNGRLFVRDKTQNGLRKAGRWSVPKGQYDVKIRRLTAKPPMGTTAFCIFTALRSIVDQPFLPMPGLSLIALRMKASGQLNGVPDQINCVAESYLPVYDGASWSYEITRNPAWAYADLLRRRGTEIIHEDRRIDLPEIMDWAAACDAAPPNGPGPYWTFDGVMEGGSIFTGLRTAASHGRASFTLKDGKYSVVRDVEQTVPVQHISPRNSWGYSGSKVFSDIPHALRVRFSNEEKQFAEDEVIVYAPGYNEGGTGGAQQAEKFETLDMPGCSRASQAWREGMYHFAVLMLRPETHVVSMDVENLRCTLGSYVRFSHDVIKIGLGWGRVKDRIVDSGNVTALILDGTVEMASGTTYGIRCRRGDFASAVMTLAPFNGVTDVVTLAAALPLANAPEAGDLYQFGESGLESAPMIVKRIAPGADLTATLSLVDAQPGVWTADQGVIPPFQTYITNPIPLDRQQPPVPIIRLTSDSNTARYINDSTVIERIAVSFDAWPSSEVTFDEIELHYRDLESPDFTPLPRLPRETSGTFIEPVQAGSNYQVRARTIGMNGITSDWAVAQVQAAGKTVPPFPPTALEASSGIAAQPGGITLNWTLSTDVDLWGTEIWASADNDRANASLVDVVADPGTTYTHALAGVVDRYYWLRSRDLSGNYSTQNEAPVDQWFPESATGGVLGQTREITGGEIDTTPPAVPTGLVLSSETTIDAATGLPSTTLVAAWNANTEEDLGGYVVEITAGSGSPQNYNAPGNRYQWTVTANVTYAVRVLAYDRVANRSAYTLTASHTPDRDITPPSAPSGLTATGYFRAIGLRWTNPADLDLAKIQVFENTVNSSGTATLIDTIEASQSTPGLYVRYGLSTAATRFYWLKAVDTSGNVSLAFSGVASASATALGTGDLDTTPPAVPTGLALSSGVSLDPVTGAATTLLTATWAENSETDLSGYYVELTEGGGQPVATPVATARMTWPVKGNTSYSARVRAYDRFDNRSAYSSAVSHTASKDTSAPAAPTGFTATGLFASVGLAWTNPTALDLVAVQVWAHTANASGSASIVATIYCSPGSVSTYVHEVGVSQTRFYWLKAVDTSGNISGFSAMATASTTLIGAGDVMYGSLNANHIGVGTLVGDRFQAGSIDTLQLKAKAVNASILNIGDTSNMFPDPNLSDPSVWDTTPDAIIATPLPIASTNILRIFANAADASRQLSPANSIPVEGGETYFVSSVAYLNTADSEARLYVRWYSGADGTGLISQALVGSVNTTALGVISGKVTAPANARRMVFRYFRLGGGSGTANFGAPIAQRAATGKLIVDGTIEGVHVKAATMTGDKFVANTIQGIHIASDTLTTRNLLIGNFDNVVPDGDYRDITFWNTGGAGGGDYLEDRNGAWSYARSFVIKQGAATRDFNSAYFPVEPGAVYKVTFRVYTVEMNGDWSFTPYIHVPNYQWQSWKLSASAGDAVGGSGGHGGGGGSDPSTYVGATDTGDVSYTFHNPVGVANNSNRQVQFRFIIGPGTGRTIVQIKMVRVSDGSLIVNGGILARHIGAGQVTADKISVIKLDAISADLGAITAGSLNINNRFIVAADGTLTIQSAATGRRFVVTSSKLQMFDASGVEVIAMGLDI